MNCSDFEVQIASESDNPSVAEHIAACRSCRAFAREMAENAAALRAMDLDPAAYTAVRERVMERCGRGTDLPGYGPRPECWQRRAPRCSG